MIVPGYKFRIIEGLITNFHQPKVHQLLLLAAWTRARLEKNLWIRIGKRIQVSELRQLSVDIT